MYLFLSREDDEERPSYRNFFETVSNSMQNRSDFTQGAFDLIFSSFFFECQFLDFMYCYFSDKDYYPDNHVLYYEPTFFTLICDENEPKLFLKKAFVKFLGRSECDLASMTLVDCVLIPQNSIIKLSYPSNETNFTKYLFLERCLIDYPILIDGKVEKVILREIYGSGSISLTDSHSGISIHRITTNNFTFYFNSMK